MCVSFAALTSGSHRHFQKRVHSSLEVRKVMEQRGGGQSNLEIKINERQGTGRDNQREKKRVSADASQMTGAGTRMRKLNGPRL